MRVNNYRIEGNLLGIGVALGVVFVVGAVVLKSLVGAQEVQPVEIQFIPLLIRVMAIMTVAILTHVAIQVVR